MPDSRPSLPMYTGTAGASGKRKVDLNHTYVDTHDNVFAQDLNDADDDGVQGSSHNNNQGNKSVLFKDDFFSRGMQRLRLNTQKSQIYGKTMSILGFNKDNSGSSNNNQQ